MCRFCEEGPRDAWVVQAVNRAHAKGLSPVLVSKWLRREHQITIPPQHLAQHWKEHPHGQVR